MDWLDELDMMTDEEIMEDPFDGDTAEDSSFGEDYFDDYPSYSLQEDWDALELGFDPYMGCYSDDC